MKKATSTFLSVLLTACMAAFTLTPVSAAGQGHIPPLDAQQSPDGTMYHSMVGDSKLVFLRSDETLWNIDGNQAVLLDSGVKKYVSGSVYSEDRFGYTAVYKDSGGENSNTVDFTVSNPNGVGWQHMELHGVREANDWYVLYENGDLTRPDNTDPLVSNVKQWRAFTDWQWTGDPGYAFHGAITAALTNGGDLYAKWEDYPDSEFQKIDTGVTSLEDNFYWKDQSIYFLKLTAENGNPSNYSISSVQMDLKGASKAVLINLSGSDDNSECYYEKDGETYWRGFVSSGEYQDVRISASGLESVSPTGTVYFKEVNPGAISGTIFIRTEDGHIHTVINDWNFEKKKVSDVGEASWPDDGALGICAYQKGNTYYGADEESLGADAGDDSAGNGALKYHFAAKFLTKQDGSIVMTDVKDYQGHYTSDEGCTVQRTDNTLWNIPVEAAYDDETSQ